MQIVQTDSWCLQIPDEWSAEIEDGVVVIFDCDGVSEINITIVSKSEGNVSDNDLREFFSDLTKNNREYKFINLDFAKGFYFNYVDDEGAWREWYLSHESSIIFITHFSDDKNAGLDDAIVDEIIATISLLPDSFI